MNNQSLIVTNHNGLPILLIANNLLSLVPSDADWALLGEPLASNWGFDGYSVGYPNHRYRVSEEGIDLLLMDIVDFFTSIA